MVGSLANYLDVRPDKERQAVHARDAYTTTGAQRNVRIVAQRPERTAMLGLTALPGGEIDPQRDKAAGRSRVHWRRSATQFPVNAAPEQHHGQGGQNREYGPLRPHCQPGGQRRHQSDHDGRGANKDEVELRVYESKLCPEKYCAGDYPTPPTHLDLPPSRRPRHGCVLYTAARDTRAVNLAQVSTAFANAGSA